jgi:hypothetical protein
MTQHLHNYGSLRNAGPPLPVTMEWRGDESLRVNYNGLIVELPPAAAATGAAAAAAPGPPPPPVIDPAQLPAIRAHWHRWLDLQQVEADSFSPMWVAYGGLVLPVVWCWPRVRRVLRRRPGCCPECGYDLRASGARCPECGATISGAAAAAATAHADGAARRGPGEAIVPS